MSPNELAMQGKRNQVTMRIHSNGVASVPEDLRDIDVDHMTEDQLDLCMGIKPKPQATKKS